MWSQGRRVEINAPKRRLVLALLLLDVNRVVSIDRLSEALWLDDPPPRARNAIQGHVSALRRLLAQEGGAKLGVTLRTLAPGYVLETDPERLDAHRFRRLCDDARKADDERACELYGAAMRLWRGEPMADVSPGARWGRPLEDVRFAAAEEYAAARLRRGEHHAVAADLPALVAEQPLRERLVSQLMVALLRAGRQGEAIDLYHRTRVRLVEQLGVDPGPDLTAAYRLVLDGQPAVAPTPRPTPDGAGTVPRPAQLPADVQHFTARREELTTLRALVGGPGARPSVVLTAVGGAAGVGKSALAIHAAHALAPGFPDGQLFVDLRGFAEADPLEPGEVLGRFLAALGTPASRLPTGQDERAALYRSLLAGRRVLVVLDNAHSSEQVRPLLPGAPGCFVVVTSRNRLDGLAAQEGAVLLSLGVLSRANAVALVTRMLGPARCADQAAVARLAECCDRLPLALRLAAARLAGTPTTPVAEFVRELEDEQRRLDTLTVEDGDTAVRSAFALSYRALAAPAARLFRLLGAHPGPDFTVPAVAALAELRPDEADTLVARLVAANLVQATTAGRYALHDLVRLYARHCLHRDEPAAAQEDATDRLVDYYLHEAVTCRRAVAPNVPRPATTVGHVPAMPIAPASPTEALAWLEAERANLRAVTTNAAASRAPERTWQLAAAQWPIFDLKGYYDDWVAVHSVGLRAARDRGDRDAEYRMLRGLGAAYRGMGRAAEGLRLAEEAAAVAAETGDGDARCATLTTLGVAYGLSGRHEDATRCIEQAVTIAQADALPFREVQALANLSWLSVAGERFEAGIDQARQGVAVCQRHRITEPLSTLLVNRGDAHRGLKQYRAALASYSEGLELARSWGIRIHEAEALEGIGLVHYETEGAETARPYWEAAYAVYADVSPGRADSVAARLSAASEAGAAAVR